MRDSAALASDVPAPAWVRAAAGLIGYLPVGRYRMVNRLRRFAKRPFLMAFPAELGGGHFHCNLRDATAAEVCFTGRYEPQETQLLQALLRPGDVFVDVGANWGYYTLTAAHRVGGGGRVVAFEPDPRLFEILAANVAINRLDHVIVQRAAIGACVERLGFSGFEPDRGNWGLSRVVAADRGVVADFESDSRPLDEALDAAAVADVRLLKIDVEGAEAGVLAGMQRGLASRRYHYIMLECHPGLLREHGLDGTACTSPLLDAGYRLWLFAQSPAMHRRAARRRVPPRELLRPYQAGQPEGDWPHILAAAPGAADPFEGAS